MSSDQEEYIQNDISIADQHATKRQNVVLSSFIYLKLNNHLEKLKKSSGKFISSQRWINNAIKNKLENSKNQINTEDSKNKPISITIDLKSLKRISEHVEILKLNNGFYSKSKWIVEAILEQLEEEQRLLNKKEKVQKSTASKIDSTND